MYAQVSIRLKQCYLLKISNNSKPFNLINSLQMAMSQVRLFRILFCYEIKQLYKYSIALLFVPPFSEHKFHNFVKILILSH